MENDYIAQILKKEIDAYKFMIEKLDVNYKNNYVWFHQYSTQVDMLGKIYVCHQGNRCFTLEQSKKLILAISCRKNELHSKLYSILINGTKWVANPTVDKEEIRKEVIELNRYIENFLK